MGAGGRADLRIELERIAVDLLREGVHVREVQIVNCTVPGNVTTAVRRDPVGTTITA